jgi:DNA-binding MarR family transcriptional regulator
MDCKAEESLGRQIYILSRDMSNFAEKVLSPFGVTLEQLHLLKCLPGKTGMTQKEICAVVYKSPANMTRMLDRMEAKDLVVRKDEPQDRRVCMIFLTAKGKKLVEVVEGVFESFSQHFLNGIKEKEIQTIKNGLQKMAGNLITMSKELENK